MRDIPVLVVQIASVAAQAHRKAIDEWAEALVVVARVLGKVLVRVSHSILINSPQVGCTIVHCIAAGRPLVVGEGQDQLQRRQRHARDW